MPHARIRRYLRHGTTPQLAVFDAIARLGSFTRAAEELHLAQPTVSTQVKKLTEVVGLPLFEQIGKRVHLTDAGRRLHATCGTILGAFADLEETLADLRGLQRGRLTLAVSTTGEYFAPRLLAAFVQRHPGLDAALHIHNRRRLLERLERNDDDLYIFANPPKEQEIVSQAIMPNPMVVFARADHPLAKERAIPFARLAEEPFLMREHGSGTRMIAQQTFEARALAPNVRMELSTNEAVKQAILAGLGVSILSRHTLGLDIEQRDLAVLDVEGFPLQHHWYFVYPVGKQVSLVARSFMEFVRVEAGNLILDQAQRLRCGLPPRSDGTRAGAECAVSGR